ncbi:MAG: hypothetical protein DSM106950_41445 [Stigonema ocellatum SAG 48.90 = DSM 106950]|nr:hypothetical protein [Stigonema ocellatum SAG 48.90 = DSM 106950]
MFSVNSLKTGCRYLFRGEFLTYLSHKKGYRGRVYAFKTADGKRKEICRIILQTELWQEIEYE